MKMMAVQYPWIFESIDRATMVKFLMRHEVLSRGLSDELVPYGLPCAWTNVDSGSQVFVRVVRDVQAKSIDATVMVWVSARSQFIEVSDAYAAMGVALVTATREPDLLRLFSLRIIAAVNESLGGGAPVAELALRV